MSARCRSKGSLVRFPIGRVVREHRIGLLALSALALRPANSAGPFLLPAGAKWDQLAGDNPRATNLRESAVSLLSEADARQFLFLRAKGEEGDGFHERAGFSGIGPAMPRSAADCSSVRGQRAASPMGS